MSFVEEKRVAIGHLLELYKCTHDSSCENILERRLILGISEMADQAICELIDVPQEEREKMDFEISDSVGNFMCCYLEGEMTKEQVVDILANWFAYYKQELSNFHRKLQILE